MMEEMVKNWEKNWARIREMDEKTKNEGGLVGRYITHPYADGKAVYEITKATKNKVTIQVVTGIGDDWILPAWGERATIERKKAEELLAYKDTIEELFKL